MNDYKHAIWEMLDDDWNVPAEDVQQTLYRSIPLDTIQRVIDEYLSHVAEMGKNDL